MDSGLDEDGRGWSRKVTIASAPAEEVAGAGVRLSWEGGCPVPTYGEMWAGSSVLMSSVAIPFPKCGLCPTEAGWKGNKICGKGSEKKS